MNIVRKYKLYQLGIPVDDNCLRIIKFIDKNLLNLTEFKEPECVFYKKGDINMFLYSLESHSLSISDDLLFVFFAQFNLEYNEINQILKDVFEEHYKWKVKNVNNMWWKNTTE